MSREVYRLETHILFTLQVSISLLAKWRISRKHALYSTAFGMVLKQRCFATSAPPLHIGVKISQNDIQGMSEMPRLRKIDKHLHSQQAPEYFSAAKPRNSNNQAKKRPILA